MPRLGSSSEGGVSVAWRGALAVIVAQLQRHDVARELVERNVGIVAHVLVLELGAPVAGEEIGDAGIDDEIVVAPQNLDEAYCGVVVAAPVGERPRQRPLRRWRCTEGNAAAHQIAREIGAVLPAVLVTAQY